MGGLGGLSESGLDVPLIVKCPARVPGGRVSDRLVDCTDIFPTLLELAGAPPPPGVALDGESFADIRSGSLAPRPGRGWIFSQYADERVVRDQRFKLYRTGGFFDVISDSEEKNNLAHNMDRAILRARAQLQRVLDGTTPAAPGPRKPGAIPSRPK